MAENKENSCSATEGCSGDCDGCGIPKFQLNERSKVKQVIGVVSGKGGVGKSLVTSLMAVAMSRAGKQVGILDADITGPSIPKMFGLKGKVNATEEGITPAITHNGIRIMSTNLLLDKEDTPVIWRGPIISNLVKQFWTDVNWSELDYMFIDMPPGTGDVALTVFQSLPVAGIIVVASPQELVSIIVKKALNMATQMNVPIIGIVENMSYLLCPDCDKKIEVFGKSSSEQVSKDTGIPLLAQIPIDPKFSQLCDAGEIDKADVSSLEKVVAKIL